MGVDVHGRGKISVAHYLLDKLDIVRAFAESCTESVPQIMDGMGLVKVQKERADRLRNPVPCLYALYIGDGGQISANPVPFDEFFSIVVPSRR